MKKILYSAIVTLVFTTCGNSNSASAPANEALHKIFTSYWEDNLRLNPFLATSTGDARYNDQFPNDQTLAHRQLKQAMYKKYLDALIAYDHKSLNDLDRESTDLLKYELQLHIDEGKFPFHEMPINQFWSFALEFPQLGSGSGNQPFKTVKDYDNWMARVKRFPDWMDTCIANMRLGIAHGNVLPTVLVEKMIPQAKSMLTIDPTKSVFYEPIINMPKVFADSTKKKLQNIFFYNISNTIQPAYAKLYRFLQTEYLPASRSTHGLGSLPQGKAMYNHLIKTYTTTTLSADSIHTLGLQQVAYLRAEMEKVKQQVNFNGNLSEFFNFMNTDKQFYIFTSAQQVLDSFWSVNKTISPYLSKIFKQTPKTKFEIRQTEVFRQATASAEYNNGSEDGTRPGIFYVPIINAKKFNPIGMETLFLHEAIPGHHYQISLQQENKSLPQFRKFLGYSAYAEGWALYTETLGKELGLYKNPYQYFGHLSDAMHRAIRLVVDAGIHTKNMTREDAIAYMRNNERISAQEAEAEIERYMAIPAQALSYKIGKLSILAMRAKYQKQLGAKFSLADFHDQLLNGGNMPLSLLEAKLKRNFE